MCADQLDGRAHIDVITGGVARLLVGPDGDPVEIDADLLPAGTVEGNWVTVKHAGGRLVVTGLDDDTDRRRRAEVQARLEQLKASRPPQRFRR